MTKAEWLEYAKRHEQVLLSFISEWHPRRTRALKPKLDMQITAPTVEHARQNIARAIQANTENKSDPTAEFRIAIAHDNLDKVNSILNEAWFGVPESTSCWRITGFPEAVMLMESVPDQYEDETENYDNTKS